MIYLDNAATSFPKPPAVAEAMTRFLAEHAANPGRSGHRMAVAAERMLDDTRLDLTRLIGASDPSRLIFTLNATDALNIAIKGVITGCDLSGRTPHVVTTILEHNSVSRPLESFARRKRIALTRVDCDSQGFVDPSAIARAMTSRTVLIVMTHASNVLGAIQDAAAVGAIARAHGALFLLDAAQTIGAVPIDVENMHIDLLAFPGHKALLGPTGTGGLYVGACCPPPGDSSRPARPQLHPWREGGTGGDSAHPTQPDQYPAFLEAGTANTVGIAGLHAAIAGLDEPTIRRRLAREQHLCQQMIDALAGDERFTLYGPADAARRVGVVAMNVRSLAPAEVAAILDDSFDIAVRAGLHCAPYIHRRLDTFPDGTLRISPGPATTADHIARLIDALHQIAAA